MKKILIIIPLLLLAGCSTSSVSNVESKSVDEITIEDTTVLEKSIEETTFIEETTAEEIEETKENLFTFDRPILVRNENRTSTKDPHWIIGSYEPTTIDLNDYPDWVRNNLDMIVEKNKINYALNGMVDIVNGYKKYGTEVKYDLTKGLTIYDDILPTQDFLYIEYKELYPAGELQVKNPNLLNAIDYTDVYFPKFESKDGGIDIDTVNGYSMKYKWVYFKNNPKFETTGNTYYSPETKDFYDSLETRNYFICDLENNGKAYLCRINDVGSEENSIAWAKLDNNCIINVLSPRLVEGVVEKLSLNCPVGYLKNIESYEELEQWAYLYSSIYNNYVNEDLVPNGDEPSPHNHWITNKQFAKYQSNYSHLYLSFTSGLINDNRIQTFQENGKEIQNMTEEEVFDWINHCVIHENEMNDNLWRIAEVKNYKFRPSGVICLAKRGISCLCWGTDDNYSYECRYVYDSDNFPYKANVQRFMDKYGFVKRNLSINDFGNNEIISEVVNYVKNEKDSTMCTQFIGSNELMSFK